MIPAHAPTPDIAVPHDPIPGQTYTGKDGSERKVRFPYYQDDGDTVHFTAASGDGWCSIGLWRKWVAE